MVTSLVSISLLQNGLDTDRLLYYGKSQMDCNDTFCHARNPLIFLLAMYSYAVVQCNCITAGWVPVGKQNIRQLRVETGEFHIRTHIFYP